MDILTQAAHVFADFADPRKRVFVGYLVLSLFIALLWLLVIKRQTIRDAIRRIFDRSVFFSGSSIADYKIFVINRLITFLISPLLLTQLAIGTAIYHLLHGLDFLYPGYFADTPKTWVVAGFTLAMFVADDLSKYLVHRWMHRFPLLWAIHKVHHSATTLTPVTVYRVHPLEGVLYALRGTAAQGSVIAFFYYLFGGTVDLATVLGANVLVFLFHVTGSNLRHSHINIRYWRWLEYILISPAQHQIHHSSAERHFDNNFGAALAIWDWLFNSLHLSQADEDLIFGLDASRRSSADDLKTLYVQPFREMAGYFKRRMNTLRQFAKARL